MVEHRSVMVSADWLREHLAEPDVRVIEATWFPDWISRDTTAQEEYSDGHIPGAVFFDIDVIADTETDLPHMLPSPVKFSSHMRKLGIGDGHRIVVYDRNGLMASARAWWMLRTMGHREVFVLDGGFQDWIESGGDAEDLPPMTSPRHHTARVQSELVADRVQVIHDLSDGAVQIIDARPEGRFNGTAPEPREGLQSGHMPGSLNVPTSSVMANGRLKSVPELKAVFGAAGWKPGLRTITTCGSGVTAPILALALHEIGETAVSVYDGSWSEYAAAPGAKIETD